MSSPEDARPIRHPPVAPQIRSNSVVCSYLIVELKHLCVLWIRSHRRHPPWKRIYHAIDKVEEHQVGSSHLTSDYVLPFSFYIALNGQGKIFQEFWNSIRPHVMRFAFGLGNLVFKIQPRSDRVVRIMYLVIQVQCGEHQLVDMRAAESDLFWIGETLCSIQTKDWSKEIEDVGRLRYEITVHLQNWGCKVRRIRRHGDFVQQIVRILRVLSSGTKTCE